MNEVLILESIMNFSKGQKVLWDGSMGTVEAVLHAQRRVCVQLHIGVKLIRAAELRIIPEMDLGHKHWYGTEITFLKENLHLSNKEIAAKMNRTEGAVALFKHNKGLKKTRP